MSYYAQSIAFFINLAGPIYIYYFHDFTLKLQNLPIQENPMQAMAPDRMSATIAG